MFVEHKEVGEVQQAKVLKLSEAIMKGLPLIEQESRLSYTLCALGCAWAGVKGHQMTWGEWSRVSSSGLPMPAAIAAALGFGRDLCWEVDTLHQAGTPALVIAARLEAKGY